MLSGNDIQQYSSVCCHEGKVVRTLLIHSEDVKKQGQTYHTHCDECVHHHYYSLSL